MARFRVSGDLLVAFVINDMEADTREEAEKLVEAGDEEVRALMTTDSIEDAVVEIHDSEEINERGECITKPTGHAAPDLFTMLVSVAEDDGAFVSEEAKALLEQFVEMVEGDERSYQGDDDDPA